MTSSDLNSALRNSYMGLKAKSQPQNMDIGRTAHHSRTVDVTQVSGNSWGVDDVKKVQRRDQGAHLQEK